MLPRLVAYIFTPAHTKVFDAAGRHEDAHTAAAPRVAGLAGVQAKYYITLIKHFSSVILCAEARDFANFIFDRSLPIFAISMILPILR